MYSIDIRENKHKIYPSTLKIGSQTLSKKQISFTNYYMMINDKPYFVISGEFHFSRYPHQEWEQELIKMKMAGINTIATYIFWIHHEEVENHFDWNGDNNLRYFVELCAKHGFNLLLRMGPFDHGACRNGGFPDWLYTKPCILRSNDELYLYYVRRFFNQIYYQVKGYLAKDGGPVVAIQLENEFMHTAAFWENTMTHTREFITIGQGGLDHMRRLKEIALECGFDVPYYTCTGWGSPLLKDEFLPLYAAYSYANWKMSPGKPYHDPTTEHLYQNFHDDEYPHKGFKPSYKPSEYLYGFSELFGGALNTYAYRFLVPFESLDSAANVKVASGCNYLGYYVFHGISQKEGIKGRLNDTHAANVCHDYQAPLGEYGQVRESYKLLKSQFYFYNTFTELFTPMRTVLPEGSENIQPSDSDTLRFACRVSDKQGFIFINNFQDHLEMKVHDNVQFKIITHDEELLIPRYKGISIKNGQNIIMPFNFNLEGIRLKYANTQLITKLSEEKLYVFFEKQGINNEYCFDNEDIKEIEVINGLVTRDTKYTYVSVEASKGSLIILTTHQDEEVKILTLNEQEAKDLYKAHLWGKERLIISNGVALVNDDYLTLLNQGSNKMVVDIYPEVQEVVSQVGEVKGNTKGIFSHYEIEVPEYECKYQVTNIIEGRSHLDIEEEVFRNSFINEVLVKVDYVGDVGNAYIDSKLVADNLYNGSIWEVGLRRFYPKVVEKGLDFHVVPLKKGKMLTNVSVAAKTLEFVGEEIGKINSVELDLVYQLKLKIK